MRKRDISKLRIGDIVWCNRYTDESEIPSIKEGHREGPFVIIDTKDGIKGLFCTSNDTSYKKYNKVKLSKSLDKITYVLFNGIYDINENNYKYFIGRVNDIDLEIINKHLYLNSKDKDDFNLKHSVGDIIKYKKDLYYIKLIRNNYIYGVRVFKYKDNYHFDVNSCRYLLNINCDIKLDASKFYKLIDVVDYKTRFKVDRVIRELKTPSVGCLINNDHKLYYIYDVSDKYYKCVQLSNRFNHKIMLSQTRYFTDFKIVCLPKNEKYVVKKRTLLIEKELKNNIVKFNTNSVDRGCFIKYDNFYYYIFGIYKDNFNCYLFELNNENKKYNFRMDGNDYYTNFRGQTIPRCSDVELIKVLSSSELKRMNNLINQWKNNKIVSKRNSHVQAKAYQVKRIIINNQTLDRYCILNRNDCWIDVINLNDYSDVGKLDLRKIVHYYSALTFIDEFTWKNINLVLKSKQL